MTHSAKSEIFSSRRGAVLATAGVAIGLGNIWRFPYMMGLYGGAAFLALYLAIVFLFGVPALMAEWALGRATGSGPFGAFTRAGLPGGRLWGLLLLVTIAMAASYYGVVLAWVLDDLGRYVFAGGIASGPQSFAELTGSFGRQLTALALTVAASCLALFAGVRRGIERLSRAVLPLFFLLFAVLIGRVLTLPGAAEGVAFYLVPRWGDLTPETALAALGQAFFSLALGGTFMVVYGRYLRREEKLPTAALATAAIDVAAAVTAGLVVVPAVFVFGLDLASGPSLMFEVMPEVFARLPASRLFGALFFGAVFLVALLSLMAAYEVLVQALGEHLGWSRGRALVIVGAGEIVLAVPALLSVDYLATSDLIWGSTMQPLGGAVAVVALAWCLHRGRGLEEIARSGHLPAPRLFAFWLRWVVPAGILITLAYGWWERLVGT